MANLLITIVLCSCAVTSGSLVNSCSKLKDIDLIAECEHLDHEISLVSTEIKALNIKFEKEQSNYKRLEEENRSGSSIESDLAEDYEDLKLEAERKKELALAAVQRANRLKAEKKRVARRIKLAKQQKEMSAKAAEDYSKQAEQSQMALESFSELSEELEEEKEIAETVLVFNEAAVQVNKQAIEAAETKKEALEQGDVIVIPPQNTDAVVGTSPQESIDNEKLKQEAILRAKKEKKALDAAREAELALKEIEAELAQLDDMKSSFTEFISSKAAELSEEIEIKETVVAFTEATIELTELPQSEAEPLTDRPKMVDKASEQPRLVTENDLNIQIKEAEQNALEAQQSARQFEKELEAFNDANGVLEELVSEMTDELMINELLEIVSKATVSLAAQRVNKSKKELLQADLKAEKQDKLAQSLSNQAKKDEEAARALKELELEIIKSLEETRFKMMLSEVEMEKVKRRIILNNKKSVYLKQKRALLFESSNE